MELYKYNMLETKQASRLHLSGNILPHENCAAIRESLHLRQDLAF